MQINSDDFYTEDRPDLFQHRSQKMAGRSPYAHIKEIEERLWGGRSVEILDSEFLRQTKDDLDDSFFHFGVNRLSHRHMVVSKSLASKAAVAFRKAAKKAAKAAKKAAKAVKKYVKSEVDSYKQAAEEVKKIEEKLPAPTVEAGEWAQEHPVAATVIVVSAVAIATGLLAVGATGATSAILGLLDSPENGNEDEKKDSPKSTTSTGSSAPSSNTTIPSPSISSPINFSGNTFSESTTSSVSYPLNSGFTAPEHLTSTINPTTISSKPFPEPSLVGSYPKPSISTYSSTPTHSPSSEYSRNSALTSQLSGQILPSLSLSSPLAQAGQLSNTAHNIFNEVKDAITSKTPPSTINSSDSSSVIPPSVVQLSFVADSTSNSIAPSIPSPIEPLGNTFSASTTPAFSIPPEPLISEALYSTQPLTLEAAPHFSDNTKPVSPEEKGVISNIVDAGRLLLARSTHEIYQATIDLKAQASRLGNQLTQIFASIDPKRFSEPAEIYEKALEGHQKIDDFFGTHQANAYNPKTQQLKKELGFEFTTGYIPFPGTGLTGKTSTVGRTAATLAGESLVAEEASLASSILPPIVLDTDLG